MHEMDCCQGVLEAVERRAAGRAVARLGVRIGAVHRIEPDVFGRSFRLLAAGGPAEDAVTEVVVVPVAGHCLGCRTDFATADPAPSCPGCGSLDVVVDGGDEIVLEWLEYVDTGADPEPALPPGLPVQLPPHEAADARRPGSGARADRTGA